MVTSRLVTRKDDAELTGEEATSSTGRVCVAKRKKKKERAISFLHVTNER